MATEQEIASLRECVRLGQEWRQAVDDHFALINSLPIGHIDKNLYRALDNARRKRETAYDAWCAAQDAAEKRLDQPPAGD